MTGDIFTVYIYM